MICVPVPVQLYIRNCVHKYTSIIKNKNEAIFFFYISKHQSICDMPSFID